MEADWIIESILSKRKRKDDLARFTSPPTEYYIKWVDFDTDYNSWHTEDELHDLGVTNFKEKYQHFIEKQNSGPTKKKPAPPNPAKWQEALDNLDVSSANNRRLKAKKEQADLSNQIQPTIFAQFEATCYEPGETLPIEIENPIKMNLMSRIDSIRGIGPKTATRIVETLKIRNKLVDLAMKYIANPPAVRTVLEELIFTSNYEDVLHDVHAAVIQYKKNSNISTSIYHRDILYEIVIRAPQIGLSLNKYWRNFVFNTPEFRVLLPSRCIICGKLFQKKFKCNMPNRLHVPPPQNLTSKPRFSLTPLHTNHISCKLKFGRISNPPWETESHFCLPPNTVWNEAWYPCPALDTSPSELWVYCRLPELSVHKWDHYDFWMLEKFFDGQDYGVRLTYSTNDQKVVEKVPGLYIKMKRERAANVMIRWNKMIYLNLY